MRNAIQALQILVRSPHSNPSLTTPAGHCESNDRLLARSSSYLPDGIRWESPPRLIDNSTQTDWPIDLFERWIRENSKRVLKILCIDKKQLIIDDNNTSPTPSPSSPPPPPYEPLSSIGVTPPRSPTDQPLFYRCGGAGAAGGGGGCGGGNTTDDDDDDNNKKTTYTAKTYWATTTNELSHRFSAGDADNSSSWYRAFHKNQKLKYLPKSRSLKFDSFDS